MKSFKLFLLILAFLFILCGCSGEKEEHIHNWDEGQIIDSPTCIDGGLIAYKCKTCDETKVDVLSALGHTEEVIPSVEATCIAEGLSSGVYCSTCKEVLVEQKVTSALGHSYVDYACVVCNFHYYTEGLVFEQNLNNKNYSVVGYRGEDKNVVVPSVYNGNLVVSISESAFEGCSSLESVIIPDSVTSIGFSTFSGCSNLISITIPFVGATLEGTSNTHFGYIFGATSHSNNPSSVPTSNNSNSVPTSLKEVIITGGSFIDSYAFSGCSSLTNIVIPDSVTRIENYAFEYCRSLTSIIIPNSVTSIGSYAFEYCRSLTSIIIPNSVTSIGRGAFLGCSILTNILVDENNLIYDSRENCNAIIETSTNTLISGCKNSIILNSVTCIGNSAFKECSSLTNIVIPNSVTSIGERAFSGCSSLTNIVIPNSVTEIGWYAFSGCSGLESLTLPFVGKTLNETKVTHFGYIFGASSYSENNEYVPSSLKEVIITGGNSIGDSAFNGCSNLESLTLPFVGNTVNSTGSKALFGYIFGYNSYEGGELTNQYYSANIYSPFYIPTSLKSVTIEGGKINSGAFNHCSSLTSVAIGKSVTSIGDGAFAFCSSLTNLVVDELNQYYCSMDGNLYNYAETKLIQYAVGKTENSFKILSSVTSISGGAFEGCSNLTDIVIPNSVTYIGNSAFSSCSSLTSVTIGNNVISIGESAFYKCSSLTSVIIPESVTSIGKRAFDGCSSLKSIAIPDSVTSIGDYAFRGCSTLTSITIPNSVTSIGMGAFRNCSSLTSVLFEEGSQLTSVGQYAFAWCSSLTSITIPFVGETLNGTNHTHFGYIFGADSYSDNNNSVPSSLKEVIITGGSFIDSYAFDGCSNLASIVIPDSVTEIGNYAFEGCSSLNYNEYQGGYYLGNDINPYLVLVDVDSSVSIFNFHSGVKVITSYAFDGCYSLESVVIPDSVTHIGDYAFYRCSSLTNIVIPDSVTHIGDYAFYRCSKLTNVTIGNGVTSIGSGVFYNCSSLTNIVIPDSVTSIGSKAFSGCSGLESLTLPFVGKTLNGTNYTHFGYIFGASKYSENSSYVPSSLKEVVITGGIDIGHYAFYGCNNITSIEIPISVTSIEDEAFNGCSSLTSVTIGNGVTQIGNKAFYDCSSLESIIIPDSVTEIGWYAFSGCSSLNYNEYQDGYYLGNDINPYLVLVDVDTVSIFNFHSGVKLITTYAFYGCSSLTNIVIPDSVTYIGACAFGGCSSLSSIVIPDSVTYIGSRVFSGCSSLESITVDENNKTYDSRNNCNAIIETSTNTLIAGCKNTIIPNSVTSIDSCAFEDCSNLTSIAIPDSVTSIGSDAFEGCSNLTSIVIPDSVTSVGAYAFEGCSSLKSVTISDSVTSIGDYAFFGCSNLTIYCEISSKPSGWDSDWNLQKRPVYWKGQWHYDENGNPTPNS